MSGVLATWVGRTRVAHDDDLAVDAIVEAGAGVGVWVGVGVHGDEERGTCPSRLGVQRQGTAERQIEICAPDVPRGTHSR